MGLFWMFTNNTIVMQSHWMYNDSTFYKQTEMVFCYQNCSSDREKVLKFEVEGREFAKVLRSLEQFIQTVKGQKNFW